MAHNPHELTAEQLFCLEGCRSQKQYNEMREAFESGGSEEKTCVFCNLNRVRNEVLWEDDLVAAWHVHKDDLRATLEIHYIIIPKRHMRFVADLTDEEIVSVLHATKFMKDEFNYQGGLFHARQGGMHLNAGTVPHLHFNDFEPDPDAIQALVDKITAHRSREGVKVDVRVPVFKDPEDRVANQTRAAEFARQYESD